jgi:hypothetical protein
LIKSFLKQHHLLLIENNNQTIMKLSTISIISLLALSCGNNKTSAPSNKDTTTSKTDTIQVDKESKLCFERKDSFKEKGDQMDMTTSIEIVTKGDEVNGTYVEERLVNGGNVDGASGDLKGTKKGDTLYLDFTYTIEGYEATEETIWILQGDKLMEKEGELVEKNGKMVLKDPNKATFKKEYLKVNCGQ